jgi:hypothetical protein
MQPHAETPMKDGRKWHDSSLRKYFNAVGNRMSANELKIGWRLESQVRISKSSWMFMRDYYQRLLSHEATLKMEATCSSETSVDFQRTTRCYIPEDRTLHNHRCENLKSYTSKFHSRVTGMNLCNVVRPGISKTEPMTVFLWSKDFKIHTNQESLGYFCYNVHYRVGKGREVFKCYDPPSILYHSIA